MAGPEGPPHSHDIDRPTFHVMGPRGWINDPNGPVYYQGYFHLFYQHLMTGCEWDWGLVWGHAVSKDLVHWEHLPPAIRPTPGSLDADGCFSGCCTIDANGVPTIMYTGVRLRSNPECGPLPPANCDLQLPFIESQLLAVADPDDPTLQTWKKMTEPFIALPPQSLPLTGWRDPFVIQRGGNGKEWIILIGAGIKGEGGTTLIYKAHDIHAAWTFAGTLCTGDPDLGAMWECPLLAYIPFGPGPSARNDVVHTVSLDRPSAGAFYQSRTSEDGLVFARSCDYPNKATLNHSRDCWAQITAVTNALAAPEEGVFGDGESHAHFYCISPDAPTNPVLYWMGDYDHDTITFDLENAVGPYRLDLGDTIYAPNILEDPHGRKIMWCWVQEKRKLGTYEYSGCMATPRIMHRRNGQLFLQPLPEIADIRRQDRAELWTGVDLPEGLRIPLTGVSGRSLDLELTFQRGDSAVTGFFLQNWNAGEEGSAAVLFDWESYELAVIFEGLDPDTRQYSLSAPNARRLQGLINHTHGDTFHLRVLLDHSMLELFTGNGQVLTTRVYRGSPPPTRRSFDGRGPANGVTEDVGIDFLSFGGTSRLERMAAWEMDSIWKRRELSALQLAAESVSRMNSLVGQVDGLNLVEVETPPEQVVMAI